MSTCNHKPKLIFTIVKRFRKIDFYSSDYFGVNNFSGDMILNLSGQEQVPNIYKTDLKRFLRPRPIEIVLDWPDCGLPPIVDPKFWSAIVTHSPGWDSSVCVHCAAGHGRTGTALACILVVNWKMSADEAITFVRQKHCQFSVETKEQVHYIYELDWLTNKRKVPPVEISGSNEVFDR